MNSDCKFCDWKNPIGGVNFNPNDGKQRSVYMSEKTNHLLEHLLEQKALVCEVCGAMCVNKNEMRRHITQHGEDYKFHPDDYIGSKE